MKIKKTLGIKYYSVKGMKTMKKLYIDIETFSDIDLRKAGLYKYAQSPNFEILLFAYAFDDEPVNIIDMTKENLPADIIFALKDHSVLKLAYNAAFEWYCINQYYETLINQWECIATHGLYCGYPGKLANIDEAMGLPQDSRKLRSGKSLIRTFCIPCKPTKSNGNRTRTLPQHEPEKWESFKKYCINDVVSEREHDRRLTNFPLPDTEKRLWMFDVIMNSRGVMVDRELIKHALQCEYEMTQKLINEAVKISGIENPKSINQLKNWLSEEIGEEIDNLQKSTVQDLLDSIDNERVKRMLEIRQKLSKTSVKKYKAMDAAICNDDRIRGVIQHYGANRTGRYAGRLVQIHNLPKNVMPALDIARNLLKQGKYDALEILFGDVAYVLSQLIRTAFIAAPGYNLIASDFSAIEARVIAWLADEQWRIDVFNTHGKIYEASASYMFGVPIDQITKGHPLRQVGKVCELALGYQGAVGALLSMRKLLGISEDDLPEEKMPEYVTRWRQANRRIVDFWYKTERAAVDAVKTGQPIAIKNLIFARETDYHNKQDFLTIRLPNGRKLYYVRPELEPGMNNRDILYYWGMDQTSKKWKRIPTYGGKLVENITQAIARDCLTENILKLYNRYNIVFHVHDEIVFEVPENLDCLEEIEQIMSEPIPWAQGLPLKAEGFITKYYKKGD